MLAVDGDEVRVTAVLEVEAVLFGEARFMLFSKVSRCRRAACLAWDSAVLASFPVALLLLLGGLLLLLRLDGLDGLGVLAGGG